MLVVTLQLFFFTRVLVAASVGKRIIPRGTFPRKKKKKLKLHSIINFSFEQNVAREWTLNRARRKQLTGHRLVNLTQNFLWLLFESNAFRLFSFASSSGSRVKAETCVAQVAPVWSPVWKKKGSSYIEKVFLYSKQKGTGGLSLWRKRRSWFAKGLSVDWADGFIVQGAFHDWQLRKKTFSACFRSAEKEILEKLQRWVWSCMCVQCVVSQKSVK